MTGGCSDTSFVDTVNGFVEVSQNKRKIILVGFDDDLSKKPTIFGTSKTAIDYKNDTIFYHINEIPLLHGGTISLLSISETNEFGMDVHCQA